MDIVPTSTSLSSSTVGEDPSVSPEVPENKGLAGEVKPQLEFDLGLEFDLRRHMIEKEGITDFPGYGILTSPKALASYYGGALSLWDGFEKLINPKLCEKSPGHFFLRLADLGLTAGLVSFVEWAHHESIHYSTWLEYDLQPGPILSTQHHAQEFLSKSRAASLSSALAFALTKLDLPIQTLYGWQGAKSADTESYKINVAEHYQPDLYDSYWASGTYNLELGTYEYTEPKPISALSNAHLAAANLWNLADPSFIYAIYESLRFLVTGEKIKGLEDWPLLLSTSSYLLPPGPLYTLNLHARPNFFGTTQEPFPFRLWMAAGLGFPTPVKDSTENIVHAPPLKGQAMLDIKMDDLPIVNKPQFKLALSSRLALAYQHLPGEGNDMNILHESLLQIGHRNFQIGVGIHTSTGGYFPLKVSDEPEIYPVVSFKAHPKISICPKENTDD